MIKKIYINKINFVELTKLLIGMCVFVGMPLYLISNIEPGNYIEAYFLYGLAFFFYFFMFIAFTGFKIPRKKVYLKNAKVEK